MSRKALLGPVSAALFLAGCAGIRETPAPKSPASDTTSAAPRVAATTPAIAQKPRPVSRPVAQKQQTVSLNTTRAELPAMIGSGATWSVPGQSMTVNSGGATSSQPVPIFRQAGALASVRAALADSPAQPQAEFRNGVLTLKFAGGSNEEIAAAVNKTLSVTGSRNLQVTLQP